MDLKSTLEALLFASGRPVGVGELMAIFESVPDGPRFSRDDIEKRLTDLREEYRARDGGITLEEVGEGWEFRTRPEQAPWIAGLNRPKPQRLSASAIETLALVAYRQPVTRADIESIRGVDSAGVLKTLLERRLIRIVGRKEEPGRPLLYGSTREFLELFGLKDLADLPPLKEFEEMVKGSVPTEGESAVSVGEMAASPEELQALEEGDRELIEELDQGLEDLVQTNRQVQETVTEPTVETEADEGEGEPPHEPPHQG